MPEPTHQTARIDRDGDICDLTAGRCASCGACINHDGCADERHPLQSGDCAKCGACTQHIHLCNSRRGGRSA